MRYGIVLLFLFAFAVGVSAQTATPTPTSTPTSTPTPTLTPAAFYLTAGYYEETHPFLSLSGSWTAQEVDGITSIYSETEDDSVSFDFIGETLIIYLVEDATGGDVDLCVDGSCSSVNINAMDAASVPFVISGLSRGAHRAAIVVDTDRTTLDALEIFIYGELLEPTMDFPTPLPTNTPPQNIIYATVQANPAADGFVVAYDLTLSPGDFIIGVLLFLAVALLMVGMVFYAATRKKL